MCHSVCHQACAVVICDWDGLDCVCF
ncbi:hypothetical protein G4923_07750 [Aeromonas rivipollensis]|uniref:LNR domain-containing protein n=1 Tax=Aeromonas rivipollensis TaxID=948519 RepID=A0ABX0CXA5_9GAMM|nr:hypothetical protein [Aeromonas veronii]MBL0547676.1 hypothetical protein [Aeromonas caviae]NEX88594.1 hypothetical protein [Aeromonas rivipollensis]POV87381.1 hypothetical protein C3418_18210 [Aeromonas sp. ASNIH8]RDD48753.1 hypothetical protein ASJ36_17610 [Aeromonas sp. ARM81]HDT6080129.1 hypothetical protein [Aeromonas veronii bv. veronii]